MSPSVSRSEGVQLRPFSGLQALEEHLEEFAILQVQSNFGADEVPANKWLELAGPDIQRLGISLKLTDSAKLRNLIEPVVMDLDDVDVLVVAMDRISSVLRENIILAKFPAKQIKDELELSESGSEPPHRILGNKFSGFRIELAIVHNKDVPGNNPTRPRTKGALIAKVAWEVKPVLSGDVIQPEDLTEEKRTALFLSKDSWMYFEAKPGFMTANSFEEAMSFYVDKALLGQFELLSGDSRVLAETLLYSSAVTQLVYELSIALREEGSGALAGEGPQEEGDEVSESQVIRLMRLRFPKREIGEILELIKDDPGRAVAEFLGDPRAFKNLLTAVTGMNGGSNELSDFEDE